MLATTATASLAITVASQSLGQAERIGGRPAIRRHAERTRGPGQSKLIIRAAHTLGIPNDGLRSLALGASPHAFSMRMRCAGRVPLCQCGRPGICGCMCAATFLSPNPEQHGLHTCLSEQAGKNLVLFDRSTCFTHAHLSVPSLPGGTFGRVECMEST